MGGGGGGPTTSYTSGYSGQGGGRIIPGTSESQVPWSIVTSSVTSGLVPASIQQDNRYNTTGLYYPFADAYGAPPSAAGQIGSGTSYVAWSYTVNGTPGSYYSQAGAGGGWGARGGTATMVGSAGGKAINTDGNTVTWIGGSNRVYGVVG